jgi:DNA-binding NarL/FixJ family response regulator
MNDTHGELTKLAIVEDQASYRKLAKEYFEGLGTYDVRAAADLDELLTLLSVWIPDVVLFDLYIGHAPQFDAPQKIRAIAPEAKVLTLTSSDHEGDVRQALVKGSGKAFDGYLTKGLEPAAMDAAIKQVLRGIRYIDPSVADSAIPNPAQDLSPSERRVLQGYADGLPPKEIAQLLPRSSKTGRPVGDRQVRRLAESAVVKLGARTIPEAISIAHRRRLVS